ncbi:MAG: recombinase RecT [Elusimicrobiota bacterium]
MAESKRDVVLALAEEDDGEFVRQIARALPVAGDEEKRLKMASRFARVTLTLLRQQPRLMAAARANPSMFMGALLEAAALDLEIGGPLAQAHLVPYKNDIVLQLGYQGMVDLVERSVVTNIEAEIVYEHDTFCVRKGTDSCIEHTPELAPWKRGAPRLVYAVAHLATGRPQFIVMTLDDISKRRVCSQAFQYAEKTGARDSPWHLWEEEMMKKTAIRALYKILPKRAWSPDVRGLLAREDTTIGPNFEARQEPDVATIPASAIRAAEPEAVEEPEKKEK